jgi:hypothetical protein
MSDDWKFIKFGLIVTGKGEREFAPSLFRAITDSGKCTFVVIRQAGQRAPVSQRTQLAYNKTGRQIPDKDAEIGADARRWLFNDPANRLIWIDDLEASQRDTAQSKYQRMRNAVDTMLNPHPEVKVRFSVHFFVNMIEAYYFASIETVNQALGLSLELRNDDCENIRHPKDKLKSAVKQLGQNQSFDEVEDGKRVVTQLRLDEILDNPLTCRGLRTLVAWCWEAIGETPTSRFRLNEGIYWDITATQLSTPPPQQLIQPLDSNCTES